MESIRNVAVLAHSGAGKTSLVEAMLYKAGVIGKPGRTEDGNTASDYTPEEKAHQTSIYTTAHQLVWDDHLFNILDTPGYADFVGEIRGAQIVADAAIIVVSAVAGVEVGTERVWATAAQRELNRLIVINKLDRDNANFERTLEDIESTLVGNIAAIHVPIGEGENFRGIIDLLHMQAYDWTEGHSRPVDFPEALREQAERHRSALVDAIVETDEALLEQYLEADEPDPEILLKAFYEAVRRNELTPILLTSATQAHGIGALLDFMTGAVRHVEDHAAIPTVQGASPVLGPEGGFSARIFKTVIDPYLGKLSVMRVLGGILKQGDSILDTTQNQELKAAHLYVVNGKDITEVNEIRAGQIGVLAKQEAIQTGDTLSAKDSNMILEPMNFPSPVMAVALHPKSHADEDKLSTALHKLTDEDPTLKVEQNVETHETVLWGMGHVHLELAVEKLKDRYRVEVDTSTPKVTYRETITGTGDARYRHKKQSGGAGQFAEVALRVAPRGRGEGFEFENKVVGGTIPTQFIPSCQKGIEGALAAGPLGGFQVVDVKATVYDGKDHPVDSKDIAFQIASAHAFREALMQAHPVLLEPIALVRVRIPESVMGDVIGNLNTRRGRILGMDSETALSIVTAHVPMAEIQNYAPELHSLTSGRGALTMKFSHYDAVPQHLAQKIVEERKAEKSA